MTKQLKSGIKVSIANLRYRKPRDTNEVKVDRSTVFGNPFAVKDYGRDGCIEKYKEYFYEKVSNDWKFKHAVDTLFTKVKNGELVLFCWCAPKRCHAEIIAEYIEERLNHEIYMPKDRSSK